VHSEFLQKHFFQFRKEDFCGKSSRAFVPYDCCAVWLYHISVVKIHCYIILKMSFLLFTGKHIYKISQFRNYLCQDHDSKGLLERDARERCCSWANPEESFKAAKNPVGGYLSRGTADQWLRPGCHRSVEWVCIPNFYKRILPISEGSLLEHLCRMIVFHRLTWLFLRRNRQFIPRSGGTRQGAQQVVSVPCGLSNVRKSQKTGFPWAQELWEDFLVRHFSRYHAGWQDRFCRDWGAILSRYDTEWNRIGHCRQIIINGPKNHSSCARAGMWSRPRRFVRLPFLHNNK
jgi:hypothetical protein